MHLLFGVLGVVAAFIAFDGLHDWCIGIRVRPHHYVAFVVAAVWFVALFVRP